MNNQETWEPPIDAEYEKRIDGLAHLTGNVADQEPAPTQLVRVQRMPTSYVSKSTEPPAPPPATTAHVVQMDVSHPATQQVVVSTSAVDRAKGYQIVITPLAIALGVVAVIVSMAMENDLLSFASFVFFWLTFVITWLAGWIVTALATPEFVSWYGAKRQWDIIEREQTERWEHYKWHTGRITDERSEHP